MLIVFFFTEFPWLLHGFTGFYWVLLEFTGFYGLLLGFTEFYWVLPRFSSACEDHLYEAICWGFPTVRTRSSPKFHDCFISVFPFPCCCCCCCCCCCFNEPCVDPWHQFRNGKRFHDPLPCDWLERVLFFSHSFWRFVLRLFYSKHWNRWSRKIGKKGGKKINGNRIPCGEKKVKNKIEEKPEKGNVFFRENHNENQKKKWKMEFGWVWRVDVIPRLVQPTGKTQ